MVGGDDVLVVARAATALPFVVELCRALAEVEQGRQDGFRLTLGIGVAIAKPTLPFHRLHAVADALAASAKRLNRGRSQGPVSVVDWQVYTAAWADDPGEVRARDWLCSSPSGLGILSQRPMPVLGEDLGSLQGLVAAARSLEAGSGDENEAKQARSQRRALVADLSRGRTLAELAFQELAPGTRLAFERAGCTTVWRELSGHAASTSVLDLVEVAEIPRLGRRTKRTANNPDVELTEPAHV
jgi:hypothetical protein